VELEANMSSNLRLKFEQALGKNSDEIVSKGSSSYEKRSFEGSS
jgi:hypothetical protein